MILHPNEKILAANANRGAHSGADDQKHAVGVVVVQ